MVKRNSNLEGGFSLVELLVAVMFIGILMAGMANVFKASVTTMATSSEGISSARRNRMSIDLLYDDLNTAGLYITDLSAPPVLDPANPAFYVIPNVAVTGAAVDDPQKADELYFYLDQPLPFEGTLQFAGSGVTEARSAAEQVMQGAAAGAADKTFTIQCADASYASMVKAGYSVVIKDSWETMFVQGNPTISGKLVTFTLGTNPSVAMTGLGASGAPPKTKHILQSAVMFYQPAQMVRYRVVMRLFDPQKATGVPCLIREQDTYDPAGWGNPPTANRTTSIVAENVSGFKVYLSTNSGQGWVGLGRAYTGFAAGWTNGMRADLDNQLATSGRADFKTTQGNEGWVRSIPTLVRLDITTRTAMKRPEYSATPLTTAAYKDFTQSLVIVPRHFGLPLN